MPHPWEPLDKYDAMDQMHRLDNQELRQIENSLGIDQDVKRAAMNERLQRGGSLDISTPQTPTESGRKDTAEYNDLGERPDHCPNCGEKWYKNRHEDGTLDYEGYRLRAYREEGRKCYHCDKCGEETTGK